MQLGNKEENLKLSLLYKIVNNLAVFLGASLISCVTFNGDTSQYLYSHFRDTIKFGIVYLVVLYLVIH